MWSFKALKWFSPKNWKYWSVSYFLYIQKSYLVFLMILRAIGYVNHILFASAIHTDFIDWGMCVCVFVLACMYIFILVLLKLHTVSGRKKAQRRKLRFQDILQDKIQEQQAKKAQRLFQWLQEREMREHASSERRQHVVLSCVLCLNVCFIYWAYTQRNCKREWWRRECSSDAS